MACIKNMTDVSVVWMALITVDVTLKALVQSSVSFGKTDTSGGRQTFKTTINKAQGTGNGGANNSGPLD